jgi:hypothetical protein
MRTHRILGVLLGPLLAAVLTPACSLFVDLGPLSDGAGGAAGGSGGSGGAGAGAGTSMATGTGGSGGQGGAGAATSTGPGGGSPTFRDDELNGEFAAGMFAGTHWSGDGTVTLDVDVDGVGTFTSRIFDAGEPVIWTTLGWAPLGPYEKALPDGGTVEVYPKGAANMTGNVLLLHLDGAGTIDPGETLPDSSGLGYDATAASQPLFYVNGPFAQAIDDGSTDYVYVDTGSSQELEFGTDDFTWSIWMKSADGCPSNKVYLGLDDGSGDTPHLWIGCTDSSGEDCPAGASGGRAGGTFKSNHQTGVTQGLCGATKIDDGQWHNLAVVKSGHPGVTFRLYVDGNEEAVEQTTFTSPIVYSTDPELALGAFSEGTYQAVGHFDEVAIWRRALTAGEIAGLYHRGVLRLTFQVRGCMTADCADNPLFVGPGGDPGLSYAAPPGQDMWVELPIDAVSPAGTKTARYFQYQATFSSDAQPAAPELSAVEMTVQTN